MIKLQDGFVVGFVMGSSKKIGEGKKIRIGIALTFGILTKESGYSIQMMKGLERAKRELGLDALEYDVRVPSIPVTDEEVMETLTEFAETKTYDLIFAQGVAMGPPVVSVAPKYPEQKFAVIDGTYGYPKIPNVATYIAKNEEAGFLRGYMLALITKTNVIGTIYGSDDYCIMRWIAATIAGAKYFDTKIKVLYAVVGSWTNPYKAEKLASLMYDYGADVVHTHADITSDVGVLRAAQKRKRLVLGLPRELDPEHILWNGFRRMDDLLLDAIRSVVEGTFRAETFAYGLKENHIGPILEDTHPLVTDDVKVKAETMKRRLMANEISLPMTKKQQLQQLRKGREIVWHPKWHSELHS
jgi:basic membrane protein A